MANKLFNSKTVSVKLTKNAAGGNAYALKDKEALAQIALTGTFNGTYYASGDKNLELAKAHVAKLKGDPQFVAKLAVYSRTEGFLKDMPAFLCATLLAWNEYDLFHSVFDRVIDNTKMLRNFVQIGRSGEAGRVINMSAGAARKAINRWFANKTPEYIFKSSLGNNPSIQDVLKLSRPKPKTKAHAALFAYLLGKPQNGRKTFEVKSKDGEVIHSHQYSHLPQIVKDFEAFKKSQEGEIPDVDFRMLDSILSGDQLKSLWTKQAESGGWHLTRMNLNNFQKYGVFGNTALTKKVVDRLRDGEQIAKSRAYPYQLMAAYLNTVDIPPVVKNSLQDAMEIAVENVPSFDVQVYVGLDVSGSMGQSITGYRTGSTSKVTCVQVASLIASCILRKNKNAEVFPFDGGVREHDINPYDSIMTNATKLSRYGGGTTYCASVLKELNGRQAKGDLVIFVSDNESWMDHQYVWQTEMKSEWNKYKTRNPRAKLVCIDLVPNTTTQISSSKDVLNVGGFGDSVFDVIKGFLQENSSFVSVIENIRL